MKSLLNPVTTTLAGLACCFLLGCGSVDPNDDEPGAGGDGSGGSSSEPLPEGPILPWAVGNSWTYQVTKDGEVALKTTTIGELEEVGGDGPNAAVMAYHVTTAKGTDLNDHTESWQGPSSDDDQRIVRYREQSFDASSGKLELDEYWEPEKLHVDGSAAHSVKGASWLESYAETKLAVGLSPTTHDVRERWIVADDDETLEVPAGTFEHVIHFQKVGGSSSKDYWYVRGLGKVKETGSQTEELTEASLVQDEP
jgi:hypothetical protein